MSYQEVKHESQHYRPDGEHCPTCGKYVSRESSYCDLDWRYHYPTFAGYCDSICAESAERKAGAERVGEIRSANYGASA